jgi:hypothetical protein
MANTLTGLVPSIFGAFDIVSRELTGFIPSVTLNASAERAAKDQDITWFKAPAVAGVDLAPAMTAPAPADFTAGYDSIKITKERAYPFGFNGNEAKALNTSVGYSVAQADMIAQAIRGLVNEVEGDLALAAKLGASRAYGTAGTTPYASTLADSAQLRKILDDNGAPLSDRSQIINTTSGAALRTLGQLTKADEVGNNMTVRSGQLIDLHGFSIKESAAVVTHTKGTAASATTNNAGYAVGATVITLASAGTGTIVAGDVITFAGDTNQYVVVSGDADVSNGGTITIAAPGLRVAMSAATKAITVLNNYVANVGFSRNALMLAARAPALPPEGDMADDRMTLTDPFSGLAFEFAMYKGFRMVRWEVSLAWGVKVAKPEHMALLLG